MTHTPGPWTTSDGAIYGLDDDGAAQAIAFVNGERHGGTGNACLIAAAPELLDAARNAHLTMTLNPDTLTPGSDEWHTMERLLAFALAKAIGDEGSR